MPTEPVFSDELRCVAYCGLYCPKCYKMKVAASARLLLNEFAAAQEKDANFLKEFSDMKPVLEKLVSLECRQFCREGGGKSATCPIKSCCNKRQILGCWECSDLDSCSKLKAQFLENNKKLRKMGLEEYIRQYE